jgi:hypothetical protein
MLVAGGYAGMHLAGSQHVILVADVRNKSSFVSGMHYGILLQILGVLRTIIRFIHARTRCRTMYRLGARLELDDSEFEHDHIDL